MTDPQRAAAVPRREVRLAAIALLIALACTGVAAGSSGHRCYPNPGRIAHDVVVRHISCRAAGRAIDRGHWTGASFRIPGYRCRRLRATSHESAEFRCRRHRAVIRFQLGG